jgi:hypothetical protein
MPSGFRPYLASRVVELDWGGASIYVCVCVHVPASVVITNTSCVASQEKIQKYVCVFLIRTIQAAIIFWKFQVSIIDHPSTLLNQQFSSCSTKSIFENYDTQCHTCEISSKWLPRLYGVVSGVMCWCLPVFWGFLPSAVDSFLRGWPHSE